MDPRDDLAGMDVARKVVILARECGMKVELSDITVQSLVPEPLRECGVDEFLRRLPEFDEQMATKAREATARGEVLRLLGQVDVDAGSCSVQLASVPATHPFAQLTGTENVCMFSEWTGGCCCTRLAGRPMQGGVATK